MPGSCSARGSFGSASAAPGDGPALAGLGTAPDSAMACRIVSLRPACFNLINTSGLVSNLHSDDLILVTMTASPSCARTMLRISPLVRGAVVWPCALVGGTVGRMKSRRLARGVMSLMREVWGLFIGASNLRIGSFYL